jgi:hypothetical protein
MMAPVFRYIVVLVAVIVVIRILLGISASKTQEYNSQSADELSENVTVLESMPSLEDEQKIIADNQMSVQMNEEVNDE